MSTVKTRMAPSPTGEYHIGGLRTLLYNYAFAKKMGGNFVLRIEDTDKVREVPGAVDRIKSIITDYGFSWDEYFVQSERVELYQERAKFLVEKGAAYYCFCTPERLAEVRTKQQKAGMPKTMYDQACRTIPVEEASKRVEDGEKYVVRLKVPENETVSFQDAIIGDVNIESKEMEDLVLLKSDGYPTYHLAVVVDDHMMGITHVMRGNEWVPSTPKHVLIYRAFGWDMPVHAHLPNLKEKGMNQKLSKRHGDVHAVGFLEQGYLPEAVLNFLMFLGWNPGTEKEIYSLEEFVQDFELERIHKTDMVAFDREKLLWINGYYLRNMSAIKLWEVLVAWAEKYGVDLRVGNAPQDFNVKVVELVQERIKTLSEFVVLTHYFYNDPGIDKNLLHSFAKSEERALEILQNFRDLYQKTDDANWNTEFLDDASHTLIGKHEYKPKEAFMTLRIALTGEKATPPLFELMEVLGKETVLLRLESLLK